MFEKISFPEHEYESIQNYLNKLGYCYTTGYIKKSENIKLVDFILLHGVMY